MTTDGDPDHAARHRQRLARLTDRLPRWIAGAVRWLLRPESRWARIPAGALLICGGLLAILPAFGLWMIPLGLLLIAEDIPFVRRSMTRLFDALERRWPHWFS